MEPRPHDVLAAFGRDEVDPSVLSLRTMTSMTMGQVGHARRVLDLAMSNPEAASDVQLRLARLLMAIYDDRQMDTEMSKECGALLAEVPPEAHLVRGAVYNIALDDKIRRGLSDEVEATAARALMHYRKGNAPYPAFYIHVHRALMQLVAGTATKAVHRQGFWDIWRPEPREDLAHLFGLIMQRLRGEASVAFRWSGAAHRALFAARRRAYAGFRRPHPTGNVTRPELRNRKTRARPARTARFTGPCGPRVVTQPATFLSGYRNMWILLMFDLPTETKPQRKAATGFPSATFHSIKASNAASSRSSHGL
ncbi:hypothetical protein SAMN05661107_0953 [Maritimibacter sp. HL-12]|nr:hypothetical protein SAMN05661107_0953 [Maritimibacter sp. HL-12]